MKIFNSLTNKKELFTPLEENKIKMYICGPTVYNYIHIGNARPVIFFDVVRRYFDYLGYEVTYVSNITDVDDKIIKAAIENQVTELDISRKYTEAFLTDIRQLNCLQFDVNPKVTEYMDKIIEFIDQLVKKEYAYEVEGDVFFRVTKLPSYGELSNQDTDNLEVGARISENSKKENPLDFTLWKKTTVGIQWESPWGLGRPGWHTECVAMIHDTLGDLIDIHGGGSDLKFPHHENEIAQSNAIAGTRLARYWMHNGRLMIDNEKMSKSLGNFIRLKDFNEHNDYRILRLFMLSTHYRQPLNYTDENIDNTKKELEKIENAFRQLQHKLDFNNHLNQSLDYQDNELVVRLVEEFKNAMDDDFNTPNAITVIMKLIKEINKSIRKNKFTVDELGYLKQLYLVFNAFLNVLGIHYHIDRLTSEDKQLIMLKDEARSNKDFERADQYRKTLLEKGISI